MIKYRYPGPDSKYQCSVMIFHYNMYTFINYLLSKYMIQCVFMYSSVTDSRCRIIFYNITVPSTAHYQYHSPFDSTLSIDHEISNRVLLYSNSYLQYSTVHRSIINSLQVKMCICTCVYSTTCSHVATASLTVNS